MSESTIPVLSEHEAYSQNTNNPTGYTPDAEEKKTLKLVNRLFEQAKAHRKKYDQKWLDNYKMFRGKQWKEQRPSYRHSEVINLIFQNIQGSVPILTDSKPKITFLPQEPSDFELSEILNQVCDSDWEKNGWLSVLTECLYDSHIYGTMFGDICYDQKLEDGAGAIVSESADPFYCYPDPEARNLNDRRGRYFIYAEPVDVDVLKKEYPDKASYIKPDLQDINQGDKTDLSQVRFKSPTDTRVIVEGESHYDASARNRVLKITLWIKDDEVIEEEKPRLSEAGEPMIDPLTGQPMVEYEQRLKYPKGRKVVVACGMVLEDGPNPYEDGKFPYIKGVNYLLPREFWGMSDVEQLESPQKIFNKLVSFALDVLTLMGNPIWVVDTAAGIDTDNLINRPGLIVEKEPGTEVRREEGVQLQPYVLQMIDRMKVWFDDVSGNSDVSRGATPGDVTAASAVTALQEAAKTRSRQKSRLIDDFLQQWGQLYLSRVFQFYTAPRVYRLTNNQNVTQYFKFHVETMTDEMTGEPMLDDVGNPVRVAKVSQYAQNPTTGQVAMDPMPKEIPVTGKFDVKVSTGSSLPFAKDQRAGMAFKLLEAGVIDGEEVLNAVDYPNKEAVLARMQQKMMEQQAQAAAMQGMPPGMPPGGAPPAPEMPPPAPAA